VRDLAGPWLLYDNQTDPYQTNNLANQPKYSKLQAKLEAALTRKLKERHDDFLPGAAYAEKWGYQVDANGKTSVRSPRVSKWATWTYFTDGTPLRRVAGG
jgi:hypothetical protein